MLEKIKGLVFDEDEHTYHLNGKALSGITGVLDGKHKKQTSLEGIPHVRKAIFKGKSVHKELELYYSGKLAYRDIRYDDTLSSVKKIGTLLFSLKGSYKVYPEVLVTDFKEYASSIDLLIIKEDGHAIIVDYKTGDFMYSKCSKQLGVYKYLLKKSYGIVVDECYIMSTRNKFLVGVTPSSLLEVRKILY